MRFTLFLILTLVMLIFASCSPIQAQPNLEIDTDADGLDDLGDNCPYHSNPDQLDTDGDGRGDICEINHVVIIDIDGLRADVLVEYLESQSSEGGALREITSKKIEMAKTTTVFPSVTFAAQASLFTGVYPQKHGITGNEWFDRTIVNKEHRSRSYTRTSVNSINDVLRVYGFRVCSQGRWPGICISDRYRSGLANEDLEAKTIYEYAKEAGRKSVVSFNMYWKGLTWGADYLHPTRRDLYRYIDNENFLYDYNGIHKAIKYINDHPMPDILTLYISGLDHKSHEHGISEQRQYLHKLDNSPQSPLGTFIEKLKEKGVYSNTVFVIVSDHGQIDVRKDDNYSVLIETASDDEIQKVIEDSPYDDIYDYYDEDRYDSFAGFNSGMLQIYLKNRGTVAGSSGRWRFGATPNPPDFVHDILPVIRSINKHRENGKLHEGGQDAVEEILVRWENTYNVTRQTSNPSFYADMGIGCWDIGQGFVMCPLRALSHFHPNYVDPENRIENFWHPTRSGDIILLASYQKGYYFDKETIGTHGSLYGGDSFIPFIIAGEPLDKSISVTSLKNIVDVAPTVADLLGFYGGIEDKFDGKSVLEPGFIKAVGSSSYLQITSEIEGDLPVAGDEAPPVCPDPSRPYCCRPLPQPNGNIKCMDGCVSSNKDCPIPK